MSEFTSSLGNPNDLIDFFNKMEATLYLLKQAYVTEKGYDNYFKKWIEDSINDFEETIKKFDYLQIKGIEEIKNAIDSLRNSMPANTGVDVPTDMLQAKKKLEELVNTMLANFENEKQQEKRARDLMEWKDALNKFKGSCTILEKCSPVDSGDITMLREIQIMVENLIAKTELREGDIKSVE